MDYKNFCNHLLSLAKNNEIKTKMESILYEGKIGNFSVSTGLMKNNKRIEEKKRAGYAYVLSRNPETFEEFYKNNINLFHGTTSNALSSILKYGMMSLKAQNNNGIDNMTGETWSRIDGHPRDFISFTDDLDLAMDYASAGNPESEFRYSNRNINK